MIDILMPRLSDTMTEGAIAVWHKKPGDPVEPGDVLVEIETDKALMEQEAYDAGTLSEILVQEGENVAIGIPIARLDDGTGGGAVPAPAAAVAAAVDPAVDPAPRPTEEQRLLATPVVRRLAKERGIDLNGIAGSGPGGRIVRADLDARSGTAPSAEPPAPGETVPGETAPVEREVVPAADVTRVPFDATRRAIATRLTQSATTVPAFHATASADVTDLLALRAAANETTAASGTKVSVNDLVVKAVALALREHPTLNASYSPDAGGQTLLHGRVHIGIAVDAPAGLVVPVVRDADEATVSAIARRTRTLAARAADRTLTASELSGGTFTVSNLGMLGVEHFTAIINPPQGAILAVGASSEALTVADGEVTTRQRLAYTLTCDHRIIDGAAAGRFLATLTALLENPLRLLVG
jgi:pyruvate dehydrogenase E2 component (dihydrolipoamide acetyltransferase)